MIMQIAILRLQAYGASEFDEYLDAHTMLANNYTNPRSAMIASFLETTKKVCIVKECLYIKSVYMCENKAEGWNVGGIWVVCFL